ncbi:MAG: DUF1704 domain-containing protein [Candidatus Diapherotrites archaeon]|nr:DUF1704 domain-containing protein [Candidatus Diapherotrites archaeon]
MNSPDYSKIDQKICLLSGSIETNLLAYINPQNSSEERKKFFESIKNGEQYNPQFIYLPRSPIFSYFTMQKAFDTYKNELKEILNELEEDTLGLVFEKKIIDLFDRMEIIRSVGTENFAGNSESYYGAIEASTLKYAKELLNTQKNEEEKPIPLEIAENSIKEFLKSKKLPYKMVPTETQGARFSVNVHTKELYIRKGYSFTQNSLKRFIAHEIEGHIYRYENGSRQPYKIFARGLSKETTETEEGVAVVVEQKEGININSQLREYAGRVIAISTATKHSFFETYTEIKKYFNEDTAFNLTIRAKRGVWKQDKGGAFTKDALYLKGMLAVQKFVQERPIHELYFGRYSTYDTPLVFDIDGLKKPKYLPRAFSNA